MFFPEAKTVTLAHPHSDHHPIMFKSDAGGIPDRHLRPLRFEGAWLMRRDYQVIWENAWRGYDDDVVGAIERVTELSSEWNKNVFGNIFKRKRLLQARIKGIQNSVDYVSSGWLQNLEQVLLKDLNDVLNQEELFWYQKSRRSWIQDGDRNTKFYHLSTIMRRNRGRNRMLKIDGVWNSDPTVLSDHINNYFFKLFWRDYNVDHDGMRELRGCRLDVVQANRIIKRATREEVRKAVLAMKRFGSPGPDGIQATFYQSYWDVVGEAIVKMVNSALSEGRVPIKILEAYISLIPKKDNPEHAGDFRPITLSNVIFKIISKVLVNRLRPLMQKIIGPYQNSFLSGRSSLDNVVLTQEVVHTMNRKSGRKGYMVVKLDLQKAYDSVDWGFLKETLEVFGFPKVFIKLILFSLEESSISVLWNGVKQVPFKPGRGLR